MESTRYRSLLWLLGVGLLCTAHVALGVEGQYAEDGGKACVECHDTPSVMGILGTAHANFDDPRSPAAQKQCQSCHGPSAVHMKFPIQVANVHFGTKSGAAPADQNLMCMQCHENGKTVDWHVSAHGFENVLCSSCHGMHDPAKVLPARAELSAGCTETCHTDLMESSAPEDFSHATGRALDGQGELTCAGCHDPHGPLSSERCGDCHASTPEALAAQSPKARRYHEVATAKGTDCMRCHKGIAHPLPPLALEEAARAAEDALAD